MSVHLLRQIESLKKLILGMGAAVEESVDKAIQSVLSRDVQLADEVTAGDKSIDQMELDIEEECLHTLALYQPVAADLRLVVAVLKINNDLERVADLAVNVAEQARFLAEQDKLENMPFDLNRMMANVRNMLKKALDALVNLDAEQAADVIDLDNAVDDMHRENYSIIESAIRQEPHHIEQLIHLLSISRNLERMGDHATNIVEDVIYMVRGDIARHRSMSR